MSESDTNKKNPLVGKQVKIFHGQYKYQGELLEVDHSSYTLKDRKEGIIILPKASCMVQEVRE